MRKRILSWILLLILIFSTPIMLNAEQWPFKEFNTNHRIRATIGSYRGTNRFHSGVDIISNQVSTSGSALNYRVYSVEDGTQIVIGSYYVWVDNYYGYIHISPAPGLGDEVSKGEYIGKVSGENHLHFVIGPSSANYLRKNALNYLEPFDDNQDGEISDMKFYKDTQENDPYDLNNTLFSDQTVVYGKVDILVKAWDKVQYAHTDYGGKLMPESLGYTIFPPNTTDFENVININFFSVHPKENKKIRLIHRSVNGNDPQIWITNYYDADEGYPENKSWNTKADIIYGDAETQEDAKYPDGKYLIQSWIVDSELNLVTKEQQIQIDNFRPIIRLSTCV